MDDSQSISRVLSLLASITCRWSPIQVRTGGWPGSTSTAAGSTSTPGLMKVSLWIDEAEATAGSATAIALGAMVDNLTTFQAEVADVADDDAMAHLEASLLRPTARARHELVDARHALLAQPLWETAAVLPTVDTVAYSGGPDLRLTLETAIAGRGLSLSTDDPVMAPGQARWDILRRCHVAVFDLRGASDIAGLASWEPARARQVAAAAYELGLAFALGTPLSSFARATSCCPSTST